MATERDVLRRIAEAFGCEPSDDDDLVEAAKELVRERDEARAELVALRKRVVEALPYPTDDDSDESRTAEEAIEMAVAERDAAYRSRDLAIKMWDEERALRIRLGVEVKFLRERTGYMREDVEERWKRLIAERDEAYRRGAEAMREACAVRAQRYLGLLIVEGAKTAEAIRALPTPEET